MTLVRCCLSFWGSFTLVLSFPVSLPVPCAYAFVTQLVLPPDRSSVWQENEDYEMPSWTRLLILLIMPMTAP